jgi:glycosyltransferase involved in cell wall biosynthesis
VGSPRTVPELSVVVPLYDEEEVLPEFHRRMQAVLAACTPDHELIYVDDGSSDESPAILLAAAAADPRVRVLRFSRNFGHQAAVTAGIEHARGDAVVIIDADLQDPPEVIPELVEQWRAGFDVVSAVRAVREGESALRLALIKIFYRVLQRISSVDLTPDVGDFRLLDRRVADALNRLPERNRYVRGLVRWLGFRHVEVPYRRAGRYAGTTKYPYIKLVRLALDGITSFSTLPLTIVTYLGFAVSALSLLLVVYALYGRFIAGRTPEGWTSVFVAVAFLSGIQLVAIGVLGAYVGRIFAEVKGRPLYVVAADSGVAAGTGVTSATPVGDAAASSADAGAGAPGLRSR